jgi:flagellar hook-length control protein FliK
MAMENESALVQPQAALRLDLAQAEHATDAGPTDAAAAPESATIEAPSTPRANEGQALLHRAAHRAPLGGRTENSATDSEPRIDAARFVGRVAGAFRVAQDRGGVLQLRLSPPELGSIKLELLVERGALTARIEAESTVTRKVLLDNLPALRERLAQQEIRVERFDVDVRHDGAGSQPDWQARERHERRPSDTPRQTAPRRAATPSVAARQSAPETNLVADGRLNVLA